MMLRSLFPAYSDVVLFDFFAINPDAEYRIVDIEKHTSLSRPTITDRLKWLAKIGIVKVSPYENHKTYRLQRNKLTKALMRAIYTHINLNKDVLRESLEQGTDLLWGNISDNVKAEDLEKMIKQAEEAKSK